MSGSFRNVRRERLDRAARLRRDQEQRALQVDLVFDLLDLARVGRVEHVQVEPAGPALERLAHHLGRQ
jgi:hypothetical protein